MPVRSTHKTALRIVSLAPNATSILLAIGAGRNLVGVSKWCKHVVPVGRRQRLGDCWKLDVREVMRLRPSLIIGSVPFATKTVEEILHRPVAFLALNPRTLVDIERDIRILGEVVGRGAAAKSLIARMRGAFKEVASRATRLPFRPRVYCEAWPNPRIASPPWVAALVEIAGGRFVVDPGARVTDDEVALAKPEIIILAWAATGNRARPSSALQNPAWQNIPAVRKRHMFVVRDELLNTPGPPLVHGVRELFRIIHECARSSKAIR